MMSWCYFLRMLILLFCFAAVSTRALATPPSSSSQSQSSAPQQLQIPAIPYQLQRLHVERTPEETLLQLARACRYLGVTAFDVYGDFDTPYTTTTNDKIDLSKLRQLEAEMAQELGMDDGVFMPSGIMAQSIALLIHASSSSPQTAQTTTNTNKKKKKYFVCHHTSHLLLHEQNAHKELLGMEPIVVSTVDKAKGISIPPMTFSDVQNAMDHHHQQQAGIDDHDESNTNISTLILELPHREIGGKLTPWTDVLKMQEYCHDHGMKFHLDGARIFEATTGYDHKSLADVAAPFDSVYMSFYKGLGGISGSMLLGSHEFCAQARIWLQRFGGNLYTKLPNYVSGWAGFRRQWRLEDFGSSQEETQKQQPPTQQTTTALLSFPDKKRKLLSLVRELTADPLVSQVLSFDPAIPEVNMVHGYIQGASVETCTSVLERVEKQHGIRVLARVRPVLEDAPAFKLGYKASFEWTMGENNGNIPDDVFLLGWREVAKGILEEQSKQ